MPLQASFFTRIKTLKINTLNRKGLRAPFNGSNSARVNKIIYYKVITPSRYNRLYLRLVKLNNRIKRHFEKMFFMRL